VSLVLSNGGTHSLRDRAHAVLLVLLDALGVGAGFIATYDESSDDLVISAARGLGEPSIEGRRMELGEHLTGWVAANGQPMMNSAAALDLAVLAPDAAPTLTLCLSIPLLDESECLTGVLSLYSGQQFTTEQLDTVCLLATPIATALSRSIKETGNTTPVEKLVGSDAS
jgi:GAF domain-containing protein